VNILLYANSTAKARLLLPWVQSLSRLFLAEVTVQTTRDPSAGERAAVEIFRAELPSVGEVTLSGVRSGGALPEEAIAAEALQGEYSLAILAPAGRRGIIRLFYGSMVGKVIRKVSTSVLIVRGGVVPPRRILTCVSGSRHSLTNVRAAARLGVAFGAPVTIYMVLSQLPVEFTRDGQAGSREEFLRSEHPLAVHLRTAEGLLHNLGATGGVKLGDGLVIDGILEELESSDHDLLVLGTHRAQDYDPIFEDLTSELVQRTTRTALVVGLRADLL